MKLSLTSKEILNKEFTKNVKGYDPFEVDSFLDIILKDYKIIDDVVLNLNEQNSELKKQIDNLNKEVEYYKETKKAETKSFQFNINENSKLDNLELLKKISAYERKLYDLGVDPSKIK